ncbi:hypothetical protein KM043_005595 [Ampulex compressa]|nr:hypothetical protein KM043_005595 [Ampulex compressa]
MPKPSPLQGEERLVSESVSAADTNIAHEVPKQERSSKPKFLRCPMARYSTLPPRSVAIKGKIRATPVAGRRRLAFRKVRIREENRSIGGDWPEATCHKRDCLASYFRAAHAFTIVHVYRVPVNSH